MQYRKLTKDGPDISLLGYGCLRFPTKGGNILKEETIKQMKYAFDQGVNYYDTAYPYHGGKSEVVLGEFLKQYDIRNEVYIADKLPTFLIVKKEQIEKFFTTQLKRLDTDYIDYYLMHMLTSYRDWQKLKEFGILKFIEEKKATGAIHYIGFSFHGQPEEFMQILEDYTWDFCQIQYNYLDVNHQAGEKGLKRAYELGIGVAIMEPLRGGMLATKAPDRVKQIVLQDEEQLSTAYWGLRFVMNHKEVSTVLSGMNDISHIQENIEVAKQTLPDSLTVHQVQIIEQIKQVYDELMKVTCTGCNYCMPCPKGVDIPATFSDYNSISFFGNSRTKKLRYMGRCVGLFGDGKSGADLCVSCGKCMQHCPQSIDIPQKLQAAHQELDNAIVHGVMQLIAKIMGK